MCNGQVFLRPLQVRLSLICILVWSMNFVYGPAEHGPGFSLCNLMLPDGRVVGRMLKTQQQTQEPPATVDLYKVELADRTLLVSMHRDAVLEEAWLKVTGLR